MPGVETGGNDPRRSTKPGEDITVLMEAFRNSRQPEIVDPEIPSAATIEIIAAFAARAHDVPDSTGGDDATPWWETEPDKRDPNDHRWNT